MQHNFGRIFKGHREKTYNPPTKIYGNKRDKKITIRIKTG